MENFTLKIKLVVLWSYIAVATATAVGLVLFDPAILELILSGVFDPAAGLLVIIWVVVPMTMAFISLTLKDSTNRWVNIVLGIIFTAFNFLAFIDTLIISPRPVHEILLEATKAVDAALIVWYAYKWPRQEAES